jgi:diadenosine tetraphosphatase ApaH/serine/threonine PP2A family protein phosphatase
VLSPVEAEVELNAFPEALCFIGHSHYPGTFARYDGHVKYSRAADIKLEAGHRYLVNVGAVGQPRDSDPRAAYVLYDDAAKTVQHIRLEYDIARAMKRILDAGLPRFLAERLQWGE